MSRKSARGACRSSFVPPDGPPPDVFPRIPRTNVVTDRVDEQTAARFMARACDRHGGLDVFNSISRLELRIAGLKGIVPWFKGLGRTFPSPSAVDVWPHARRATFFDYPARGDVGIYDSGRVTREATATDAAGSRAHRQTFGRLSKWRRWTPEDALYFFGYSLVDYVSLPFTLLHRELIDARRTTRGIEMWYRFPSGADTHSTVQGFYFDESGLLLRHDYRADIMGTMFNGAHVHREHRLVCGILLATHRTVYAKPWHYPVRTALPVPVLEARLLPRESGASPRPG